MMSDEYFELWQLIGLFGEDYDLFGEDVKEIALHFKEGCSKDMLSEVIRQIDDFQMVNKENVDSAFVKTFGELGHVNMWGHKPASFLDELKRLLQK